MNSKVDNKQFIIEDLILINSVPSSISLSSKTAESLSIESFIQYFSDLPIL